MNEKREANQYVKKKKNLFRSAGSEGARGNHETVAGGDKGAEVGAGPHPRVPDKGRRDGVRRDPGKDPPASGDLSAAHGRTRQVQTVPAAPRVPGPPQRAFQRRQLNDRRRGAGRPDAGEQSGTRVAPGLALSR